MLFQQKGSFMNVPGEDHFSESEDFEKCVPAGFVITGEKSANWLVRKVKESRSYAEHVLQWAARELRRTKHEEHFLMSRYGPQLEAWTRKAISTKGNQRRSIRLPAGNVGFRVRPPKPLIADPPTLINWCKTNLPEAYTVRVRARGEDAVRLAAWFIEYGNQLQPRESVDRATLRDHVNNLGEVPPGVQVTAKDDRFFIK
jgi:hypothetical protein